MPKLTPDEMSKLADTMDLMGAKPKADTPADLEQWMLDYLSSKGKLQGGATSGHSKGKDGSYKMHNLKLSTFSGDGSSKDNAFDLWKFEVECLIQDKYAEEAIRHAIRQSLKGAPARMAMRLGAKATPNDILVKLSSVYSIDESDTYLRELCESTQLSGEDVVTWGCRLEELMEKACQSGLVSDLMKNRLLRSVFWTGLRSDLKNSTRHKYDAINNFDQLRTEVRAVELEQAPHVNSKSHAKMCVNVSETEAACENPGLTAVVERLTHTVSGLQKQLTLMQQHVEVKSPTNHTPSKKYTPHTPHKFSERPSQGQTGTTDVSKSHNFQCWKCGNDGHLRRNCPLKGPICWKCGQHGHVIKECPHLN